MIRLQDQKCKVSETKPEAQDGVYDRNKLPDLETHQRRIKKNKII